MRILRQAGEQRPVLTFVVLSYAITWAGSLPLVLLWTFVTRGSIGSNLRSCAKPGWRLTLSLSRAARGVPSVSRRWMMSAVTPGLPASALPGTRTSA